MFLFVNLSPVLSFNCDKNHEGWEDIGPGDWLGFYDILRNSSGNPLGVRIWPFEQLDSYIYDYFNLEFFYTEGKKACCFFFGNECNYDEAFSGDQLMDEARIVKRNTNELAFVFSLITLSLDEQKLISKNVVNRH
jgi:hypothetical protein